MDTVQIAHTRSVLKKIKDNVVMGTPLTDEDSDELYLTKNNILNMINAIDTKDSAGVYVLCEVIEGILNAVQRLVNRA